MYTRFQGYQRCCWFNVYLDFLFLKLQNVSSSISGWTICIFVPVWNHGTRIVFVSVVVDHYFLKSIRWMFLIAMVATTTTTTKIWFIVECWRIAFLKMKSIIRTELERSIFHCDFYFLWTSKDFDCVCVCSHYHVITHTIYTQILTVFVRYDDGYYSPAHLDAVHVHSLYTKLSYLFYILYKRIFDELSEYLTTLVSVRENILTFHSITLVSERENILTFHLTYFNLVVSLLLRNVIFVSRWIYLPSKLYFLFHIKRSIFLLKEVFFLSEFQLNKCRHFFSLIRNMHLINTRSMTCSFLFFPYGIFLFKCCIL